MRQEAEILRRQPVMAWVPLASDSEILGAQCLS